MPVDGTGRIFGFGVFEADEGRGELRKHGIRVKLHAQPFHVLVMLLERPAEVVARDEMRSRLWGTDTFVDFDHGLNSAVNKIREALDDSAAQPRYVETVSGKGYRFIAPVTLKPADAIVPPEASAAQSQEPAVPCSRLLSETEELPHAPQKAVRILLLLVQVLYLAFYLTALGNLHEIDEIALESRLPMAVLVGVVVATAAAMIPVRLYLAAAVAFELRQLPAKFRKMFPVLLVVDLLWALSPFLLIHYVSAGLALGFMAALVYLPFAQRSLVLMYGRGAAASS